MIHKLPALERLFKQLQQVPYVAHKHMYKMSEHFLLMDSGRLEEFCATLLYAHQQTVRCTTCFCWYDRDQACLFCGHTQRNQQIICVVEHWVDVIAIEKSQGYAGVYHVLGGVINPLQGIGPEDLTILELVKRIEIGSTAEVILANNATPEGEATVAYIASKLKKTGVSVSCLARGLPIGGSLEYADRVTVYKAMSERKLF